MQLEMSIVDLFGSSGSTLQVSVNLGGRRNEKDLCLRLWLFASVSNTSTAGASFKPLRAKGRLAAYRFSTGDAVEHTQRDMPHRFDCVVRRWQKEWSTSISQNGVFAMSQQSLSRCCWPCWTTSVFVRCTADVDPNPAQPSPASTPSPIST